MSEPKRLSAGDDLGAALLGSARGDMPSAASRARAAAALGLGGVAVGGATLAAGGVAKAASASIAPKALSARASIAPKALSASASIAPKAANALWLKLLAGGVVALAVAGGVAVKLETAVSHPDATIPERQGAPVGAGAPLAAGPASRAAGTAEETLPPAPAASSTLAEAPVAVVAPERVIAPQRAAVIPVPTRAGGSQEPPETARSEPRAPSMTSTTVASAGTPAESPLAQELRSLDHARSALGRGEAAGTLAELDRHDRAFPAGPLRTEAKVLRAEALLARGDRAAARKLAGELLARDPSGPYARRLHTIAEGAP